MPSDWSEMPSDWSQMPSDRSQSPSELVTLTTPHDLRLLHGIYNDSKLEEEARQKRRPGRKPRIRQVLTTTES